MEIIKKIEMKDNINKLENNIVNNVDYSKLVCHFHIDKKTEDFFFINKNLTSTNQFLVNNVKINLIDNLLTKKEINELKRIQSINKKVPVGIDGFVKNYKLGDFIQSYRSTIYSEHIANVIFQRIKHILSDIESPYHEKGNLFTPITVNPSMRFIEYNKNGQLIPHYDFPYVKNDKELTLLTLVIYLDTRKSGATRFIKEYRTNDYSDLKKIADPKDVLLSINPCSGKALLFQHQILHDSDVVLDKKLILRTDIIFKRVY